MGTFACSQAELLQKARQSGFWHASFLLLLSARSRSGHVNGNSSQNSAKPGKAPIAADATCGMPTQRSEHDMQTPEDREISRRDLMIGTAACVVMTAAPSVASAAAPVTETPVTPN